MLFASVRGVLVTGQYEVDGTTFHTLRHRFNSKLDELGVTGG